MSCVSMLSMAKQLVCKLEVLQPQPSVANWYIYSITTKFEKFGIFSKLLVHKFLIWYI